MKTSRRIGAALRYCRASALAVAVIFAQPFAVIAESPRNWRSHPPIRVAPAPSQRPLGKGPTYFAHPTNGDDTSPGTEQKPWKTITHSLLQLKAGDTLCLRGGTYFEQIRVSLAGKADAPFTIRGYPGEQATINGGIREFLETPQQAWEAVPGTDGEFRSTRAYPNIRDVVGAFGDSFVGLQTYWHRVDLTATNELWIAEGKGEVAPVYCGPGLWYDRETSRIHVRLAHTHLDWQGVPNYQGETDPRKLLLVIGPFASTPLRVDGARHVRFQDLTICGGGFETVVIEQGLGIEFDNVTVRCGTYGLIARNTIGFRFHNSALYGNIPPWGSRVENSLRNRSRPGDGRDVARLTGHALLVADGNDEFSVYAFPFNRDWEISNSEFTDCHDGLYLGGVENVKFHHNLLDACHDDGIYLSQVYPYAPQSIYIYQNHFARCLTTLAFGGAHSAPFGDAHPPRGPAYVYRNVFDLSGSVNYTRPTAKEPSPKPSHGKIVGDHGSPVWAPLYFYQNTCVLAGDSRQFLLGAVTKQNPRRVFNNIFCYLESKGLPKLSPQLPADANLETDGNLYWLQSATAAEGTDIVAEFRKSNRFEESKTRYAPGWEANSLVADPKLTKLDISTPDQNDYRLREGSAAIGKGLPLPADWQDPLRSAAGKDPDIGALPFGTEKFEAGRIRR